MYENAYIDLGIKRLGFGLDERYSRFIGTRIWEWKSPDDGSCTTEGIRIRDMMIANGNHTIKKVKNMTS